MSQVEHRAERSFAIKGTLVFTAQRDQFTIMEDAYLVCEGKKVAGAYDTLPDQYRQIDVLDMGGKFVIPGTCDIHVHASQASFQGIGQNIENGQWNTWFDRYAFPDESRFNDIAYAEQAYTRFAESLLATPTTRLCAYATTSREATEILMKVLAKYGFAGYVGKVNMDRNSSPGLLETTQETITQTRLWLEETKTELVQFIRFSRRDIFPAVRKAACSSWDSLQKNTTSRCSRTFQRGWMKSTGCGSLHRILTIMHRPMTVRGCLDRRHRP